MQETTTQRWKRWGVLKKEEKHSQIVLEFDEMLKSNQKIVACDRVMRTMALETMGLSIITLADIKKRKKRGKSKRRKS